MFLFFKKIFVTNEAILIFLRIYLCAHANVLTQDDSKKVKSLSHRITVVSGSFHFSSSPVSMKFINIVPVSKQALGNAPVSTNNSH